MHRRMPLLDLICVALWASILSVSALAQNDSGMPPEMREYLDTLTPSQQEQVIGLLSAGVANGKWKEGLMFEGNCTQ